MCPTGEDRSFNFFGGRELLGGNEIMWSFYMLS